MQSIIKGEGGHSDGQYTSSRPRSSLAIFCRAGSKPRSVRLQSPYFFLFAAFLLTREESAQFRHKVVVFLSTAKAASKRWSQGHNSFDLNCTLKLRPRRQCFPTLLTSRAGTFQYMSHVVMQFLKRERSFQEIRRIFDKTKVLRTWSEGEPKKSSKTFQTIFRSVCISFLNSFSQTAESSIFRSCTSWIRCQHQPA